MFDRARSNDSLLTLYTKQKYQTTVGQLAYLGCKKVRICFVQKTVKKRDTEMNSAEGIK